MSPPAIVLLGLVWSITPQVVHGLGSPLANIAAVNVVGFALFIALMQWRRST